jgi:hypothetical protein
MFHAERRVEILIDDEDNDRFSEFCERALKRFHNKIPSNAQVVAVYSTGACYIIWKIYLSINIADDSS